MPDVTVVVLTYRSRPTIDACLRSVKAGLGDLDGTVVVVDNASDDGTPEVVKALADELPIPVDLVVMPENTGFSKGCNTGLDRATAPWVVFLNPDAVCPPAGIELLVRVARSRPDAGIVAPSLVGADRTLQPTLERTFHLSRVLAGLVRIGGAIRPSRPPEGGPPVEVPWVHAAVILMPTALLRRIGGLDERFFLYAEDMDLCTRVRAAGRKVLVAPEVRFGHIGGFSASLSGGDAVTAGRRTESLALYLRIHEGRWASAVFGAVAGATYGVAALVERVIGRDPEVHRAMAAAALRSLKTR